MFTAQALGEVAVSALLGRTDKLSRSTVGRKTRFAIGASLVGGGAALIAIAALRALTLALALNLIFGALTGFASVHLLTLLQRSAPNRQLGRRLARYAATQAFAQPGGLALASICAVRIDTSWLIAVNGVIYVVCGGLAWARCHDQRLC